MKTALRIFWHDLRQLLRNPFALIVVVGLVVLPSVYAWYSIDAMWDPYAHTGGLKVAVVDNDQGARLGDIEGIDLSGATGAISAVAGAASDSGGADESDDGSGSTSASAASPASTSSNAADTRLNVGALMVSAMKADHSLDWQFVDEGQGRAGLESGEYYAAFVLPDTFTQDFLSVLSGDPTNPTIEYWVNEKYNAVAIEVTDAGAGVVDAIVNRIFSAVIADAISGIMKDVASDILSTGATVTSQARQGLQGAESDLKSVIVGAQQAQATLEKWQSATEDARDAVDDLKDTIPSLRASLERGETQLANVRTASHAASSAYSSVLSQGGEFTDLLSDISKRVKAVAKGVEKKQGDIKSAVQDATDALDASDEIIAALLKADPESRRLQQLESQADTLREQVQALGEAGEALGEAAVTAGEDSAAIASDIDDAIAGMKGVDDTFTSQVLPDLDEAIDSVARIMGSLDGALTALDAQATQTQEVLGELESVLGKTGDVLESTATSLDSVADSLDAVRSDLASLAGSSVVKQVSSLANIDVKSYGSFMASPVNAQLTAVYPLNSYGSGVAPFYTCLAIWVGCFMLIAVIKLEVNPELFPRARPWQGYVGRLILFTLLALLQGAVVTVGDLVLGVQAVGQVSLVVAGLCASWCFMNIVYALGITFKHVGKALAVVFLIVQIPGASGMYPVQLMPDFFQALYPWLPFTYGMGAMREAIGGFYGSAYLADIAWLLACGLLALALALIVRPAVLNLNRLFDRKLASADVYVTEEHGFGGGGELSESPFVKAMLATDEGRGELADRARTFAQRYSLVKQVAPISIVVLTAALGIVSMLLNLDADGKLVVLVVFIAAVVAVFCLCVAFEYAYEQMMQVPGLVGAGAGGAGGAGGVGGAGGGWRADAALGADAGAVTRGRRAPRHGAAKRIKAVPELEDALPVVMVPSVTPPSVIGPLDDIEDDDDERSGTGDVDVAAAADADTAPGEEEDADA